MNSSVTEVTAWSIPSGSPTLAGALEMGRRDPRSRDSARRSRCLSGTKITSWSATLTKLQIVVEGGKAACIEAVNVGDDWRLEYRTATNPEDIGTGQTSMWLQFSGGNPFEWKRAAIMESIVGRRFGRVVVAELGAFVYVEGLIPLLVMMLRAKGNPAPILFWDSAE